MFKICLNGKNNYRQYNIRDQLNGEIVLFLISMKSGPYTGYLHTHTVTGQPLFSLIREVGYCHINSILVRGSARRYGKGVTIVKTEKFKLISKILRGSQATASPL